MRNLPFAHTGRFYRGNLHTHSTNSDGDHPPHQVIDFYRDNGYHFLALTDHFLEMYGWKISDTRDLRSEHFTTLIAAELHAPATSLGELWHIKAIGLPLDFAKPVHGESGPEIARRASRAGAFIGIVHPSWYGLTVEDARQIPFANAVEIYNHGSAVEVDRGSDWPFCDLLLNGGWRLTGYASDDAHHLTHDCLGGWVQVKAESLEPEALLEALKDGRYYSSQGPEIHDIRISNGDVTVACSPASTIAISGRGSRSQHQRGTDLSEVTLPLKRFKDGYFRVTVTDAQNRKAWSNPIWLD
ncbi:MAG: CehA/McbA family metallohydrolase [Pseudomonadota bacterium]